MNMEFKSAWRYSLYCLITPWEKKSTHPHYLLINTCNEGKFAAVDELLVKGSNFGFWDMHIPIIETFRGVVFNRNAMSNYSTYI